MNIFTRLTTLQSERANLPNPNEEVPSWENMRVTRRGIFVGVAAAGMAITAVVGALGYRDTNGIDGIERNMRDPIKVADDNPDKLSGNCSLVVAEPGDTPWALVRRELGSDAEIRPEVDRVVTEQLKGKAINLQPGDEIEVCD